MRDRKISYLKNYILFAILIPIFILVGISFGKYNNFVNAQSDIVNGPFNVESSNYLTNNVVFINFKDESTTYNAYKNTYTTFNALFNEGDADAENISIKDYFYTNSNEKFTLQTDIISNDNQNVKVFTLDKPRTYYLPYLVKDNNATTYYGDHYTINEDGYFDYYLVENIFGSRPDFEYATQDPTFYLFNNLIAKVYKTELDVPSDSDYSDKIITYDEALVLESQNKKYFIVKSFERMIREYELLCNALEKAGPSMNLENSDLNGDKYIDSFSISILDDQESSQYETPWSSLLWPHKVSIGAVGSIFKNISIQEEFLSDIVEVLQSYGFIEEDIQRLISYASNQPSFNGLTFNTISLQTYNMSSITTKNSWVNFVKDITTPAHELGHILGLPDLYLYNDGDNDDSSVGSWSHMCNSHASYPSFWTSYEREKMGWIKNDTNIQSITQCGIYTLSAVNGIDDDNLICYKVQDPNYTNKYVYFEYRNPTYKTTYDSDCGSRSGLLVYSVDVSANGNSYAPPYEIYVNRPVGFSVYFAAIGQNEGKSLGNTNKNVLTNAIIQNYDTDSKYNTGILVKVLSMNENSLTFRIESSDLDPETAYTKDDFGGNELLYNKLLKQSNIPNLLTKSSFIGKSLLDASSCNLTSFDFLTKFELSDVKYLDLSDNNLDSKQNYSQLAKNYNFERINLCANVITLNSTSQITTTILKNSIFDWGMQLNSKDKSFINTTINLRYFYNANSHISSISVCNSQLPKCVSGSSIQKPIDKYGVIEIKFEFKDACYGYSSKTYQFRNIKVSTPYSEESKQYAMVVGQTFPSISEMLSVDGIDITDLKLTYKLPATNKVSKSYFVVNVSYDNADKDVSIYYNIIDLSVSFNNGNPVMFEIDELFSESLITVCENGIETEYIKDSSSSPLTYTIHYFKKCLDIYEEEQLISVESVDTGEPNEYVARYTLYTSFGISIDYDLTIIVSDNVLKQSNFVDENLYNKLLQLANVEVLQKTDFAEFDYIDLSNLNLTSVKGLEYINFKQNAVIDLCNNNLSNLSEVESIIQKNPTISSIYLVMNNFDISNIISSQYKSKFVVAIQNMLSTVFTNQATAVVADIVNDYDGKFTLNVAGDYQIDNEKHKLKLDNIFGIDIKVEIKLNNSLIHSYTKKVNCFYVGVKSDKGIIKKEYSEDFKVNYNDLFEFKGCKLTSFTITSNYDDIKDNLSVIGEYEFEAIFKYKDNTSWTLSQTIKVQDTTPPVLTLNGPEEVYIKSLDYYLSKYDSDVCTAEDGYDGVISKINKEVPTIRQNAYGEYTVTYSATDKNKNTGTKERKIYYGYITLTSQSSIQDINTEFVIPFTSNVFKESDFTITYKTTNEQTYKSYDKTQGIKISSYGKIRLNIHLVHNKNADIVYDFSYTVTIKDNIKPVIELKGENSLSLFAGQNYIEQGYTVSDNDVQGTLTENTTCEGLTMEIKYRFKSNYDGIYNTVSNFDTTRIGYYQIVYIAKDGSDNRAEQTREIQIVYSPIASIKIDETKLMSIYTKGQTVKFTVECQGEYITSPNPNIVWYINDKEFRRTEGLSLVVNLDDLDNSGDYVIFATVDDGEIVSQTVQFKVVEESPYESVIMIVAIIVGVCAVGGIIAFFVSKIRKRNFY